MFVLGWFKLGALVRYIPVSIVVGFTNGIAVLIALSQLKDLLGLSVGKVSADFASQVAALTQHIGDLNLHALALGLLCLAGLFLWPWLFTPGRLRPAALLERAPLRVASRIPGTIVALVTLSLLATWLQWPVETIGSRFGGIPRSLPDFVWPDFSWGSAQQLFIPTITIALLGAIESLLCARVADNLATFKPHDPNQELMAQGVANFVVPFFGGIPATGTIARTVTNLRAGAVSPIAGLLHAATLLVIVLVAAPLAAAIPLAVLAGVLLYVAWNMGEWSAFRRLGRHALEYRTKLLATFLLTVIVDLTVAVEVGLVLACVFFIYRMSTLFNVETDPAPPEGVHIARLYGSLFFGAVTKLEAIGENLAPGTRAVVLEMHQLVSVDSTGLDALEQLHRVLKRGGVRLLLCAINPQPLQQMRRAELDARLGPENLLPDLASALAAAATPLPAGVPGTGKIDG